MNDTVENQAMTNSRNIDAPSVQGQFGWEQIGTDDLAIPVILRSDHVRYSPVRIVEQEIIKKYDALPQSVFQCITLKSYYLTASEAKLLNHVNFHHANGRYGKAFFDVQNVIITASDVKDLSRFLNISLQIFRHNLAPFADKLGIIKLSVDETGGTLLVPYICKMREKQPPPIRLIPIDMVKNFVTGSASTIRTTPTPWDIMYLKMLSIYCENNSLQYVRPDSKLILLDGLEYSGTGSPVMYEDYLGKSHGL